MKKVLYAVLILFLLSFSAYAAGEASDLSIYTDSTNTTTPSNDDICSTTLTGEEKRLYDLIMEYRKSQGLPPIPISPSLTFVAQTHARDLFNHPPSANCNGHSWSTYGNWSSCCYTPDHAKARCMWDKPRELTDYTGSGFEIAVGGSGYNETITPEMALSVWKKSPGHNAVIINSGTWKKSEWKAIGIGLYGSRGVVWFGKVTDACQGK